MSSSIEIIQKSKTMQKEKRNYTVSKYFTKIISFLFEKAELTSLLNNVLKPINFQDN